MCALRASILRLAPANCAAIVCGETGAGKEGVIRNLHAHSLRHLGPLVVASSATIPDSLADSILFGAEKGSHSTATVRSDGLFEQAERGILVFDELDKSSAALQAKLLRTLESREIRRVGGRTTTVVDVRFVAMMAQDPDEAMAQGKLLPDLYFRLAGFVLYVPPLRERREDIPELCAALKAELERDAGTCVEVAEDATKFLRDLEWHWPGNVRELRQLLLRAALVSSEGSVSYRSIQDTWLQRAAKLRNGTENFTPTASRAAVCDMVEVNRRLETGASLVHLANELNWDRTTLSKKLKQWRAAQGLPPRRPGRPSRISLRSPDA